MKNKKRIYRWRCYGHPTGRQEPRAGRHGWYTPPKTKKYYEHIRNSFQQLYPRLNDRTHKWKVRLDIYVIVETRKGKEKQYPDNSNVAKGFEDALQGCIWHNDKQIWDGPYPKRHSVKSKKEECVEIYAEQLGER